MTDFIADEVRDRFDSSRTEAVELLVGFRDNEERVRERLEELGGEINKKVGRTTLRVTIAESELDAVCGIDPIISVEFDKQDVRPQEGNLQQDQASMM